MYSKSKDIMGNMSYCRFENTLNDLRDCYNHMGNPDELSGSEKWVMLDMINLCKRISEQYDHMDDDDIDPAGGHGINSHT